MFSVSSVVVDICNYSSYWKLCLLVIAKVKTRLNPGAFAMVIEFLDFRSIAGTAHPREKFPEKWKNFQRVSFL